MNENTWAGALRVCTARVLALGFGMMLGACAATPPTETPAATAAPPIPGSDEAYPSTYKAPSSPPTLIRGATILTGTGTRIDGGDVLIVNNRIAQVGTNLTAPADA